MAKVSTYIYGILVIALFVSLISFTMLGFYEQDSTLKYGADNLTLFSKLDTMSTLSQELKNSTTEATTESGVLDKLGAWFTSGYQAFKISFASIDSGVEIVEAGSSKMGLGSTGTVIKNVLLTMMILSLIFAIIYFITQREP